MACGAGVRAGAGRGELPRGALRPRVARARDGTRGTARRVRRDHPHRLVDDVPRQHTGEGADGRGALIAVTAEPGDTKGGARESAALLRGVQYLRRWRCVRV